MRGGTEEAIKGRLVHADWRENPEEKSVAWLQLVQRVALSR